MTVFGYARVSGSDQNLDLQETALRDRVRDHQIRETQPHHHGGTQRAAHCSGRRSVAPRPVSEFVIGLRQTKRRLEIAHH